jgi:predicted DNA-binding transcriptional regulator AlpA
MPRPTSDPPRHRPPSYLSRRTLADELDAAESTVDELVRRGILPKPVHLSSGCGRWSWTDVDVALASLKGASVTDIDPYLTGARSATKQQEK